MCKPDTSSSIKRSRSRLLLSLESYGSSISNSSSKKNDDDGDKKQEQHQQRPPDFASCVVTGVLLLAVLVASEQAFRFLFAVWATHYPEYSHELLQDATNRAILARHLGVDALSCAVVAGLGWMCRHDSIYKVLSGAAGAKNNNGNMAVAGYEQRLFTYNAAAFRVALFFFMYQVKNLIDTLVWNDGPEFIFHHAFSLLTAWGAMSPGCGHMYAIFYFGISEISTMVLCLLANFDDQHGVVGLGDAMPTTKVVLGGLFVVLFITCRCILWPIMSYYFCRDILQALKTTEHNPRAKHRSAWMKFFLVSLSGISVLQVAWLGQIFVVAKEELAKFGAL